MRVLIITEIVVLLDFVQNDWIEVPQFHPTTQTSRISGSSSFTPVFDDVLESPPITPNSSIIYNGNDHKFNVHPDRDDDVFQEVQTDGFLSVFKNIQRILVENADKTVRNKIKFLRNMQTTIMETIYEKITKLWSKQAGTSEPRGYHEHEMDFPSNEAALMTIGFLTFAVFLIKLVLKLIHALKNKHAMKTATTAGATAYIGRKRRDIEFEPLEILRYIEEYKFAN